MNKKFLFYLIVVMVCFTSIKAQSKRNRVVTPKPFDIHKINFKAVKYQVGAKVDLEGITQKDLKVLNTKFGDLTGDGNDEAVVYISYSMARYGGNGYGYFVDIFTAESNKLTFLTRLAGGGKSSEFQIKLLDIKDSQLIVKQCEMNEDYEQFFATVYYEWNGERLIEVSRSRVKSENCWG